METLASFYVIVTSLIGTTFVLLLAVMAGMDIWAKIRRDLKINKMDKSFADSNRP